MEKLAEELEIVRLFGTRLAIGPDHTLDGEEEDLAVLRWNQGIHYREDEHGADSFEATGRGEVAEQRRRRCFDLCGFAAES